LKCYYYYRCVKYTVATRSKEVHNRYYCKEKHGGGEYSQLSIAERENDDVSDEEEDNIEQAVKIDDEDATTLLGHLRKELQFDWRMVRLFFLRMRPHSPPLLVNF